MTKPSLYALLARSGQLTFTSGDRINEYKTLRTLSAHFDVYYNNEAFVEDTSVIGSPDRIGPDRDYDYYYIRNNPEVFSSIDGVRISFAYPYHKEVFEQTDAFIVLTENWKRHLNGTGEDSETKLRTVYNGIVPEVSVPVINVGQTSDEALIRKRPSNTDLFRMRVATTNSKNVFGYYGNLSHDLYPLQAFAALEGLAVETGSADPVIALAGQFRAESHISYRNSVYLGSIPYSQMAALHSVTLANLTNESPLNHCLGNQKVIDSASLGIPVLCKRLDTFVEQLGSDYPCFYETEIEAYQIAKKLITDNAFLESVRRKVLVVAQNFQPETVRDHFLAQPELLQFS